MPRMAAAAVIPPPIIRYLKFSISTPENSSS
jgi:hypothetical protein